MAVQCRDGEPVDETYAGFRDPDPGARLRHDKVAGGGEAEAAADAGAAHRSERRLAAGPDGGEREGVLVLVNQLRVPGVKKGQHLFQVAPGAEDVAFRPEHDNRSLRVGIGDAHCAADLPVHLGGVGIDTPGPVEDDRRPAIRMVQPDIDEHRCLPRHDAGACLAGGDEDCTASRKAATISVIGVPGPKCWRTPASSMRTISAGSSMPPASTGMSAPCARRPSTVLVAK